MSSKTPDRHDSALFMARDRQIAKQRMIRKPQNSQKILADRQYSAYFVASDFGSNVHHCVAECFGNMFPTRFSHNPILVNRLRERRGSEQSTSSLYPMILDVMDLPILWICDWLACLNALLDAPRIALRRAITEQNSGNGRKSDVHGAEANRKGLFERLLRRPYIC
jgi:hypothetical protein